MKIILICASPEQIDVQTYSRAQTFHGQAVTFQLHGRIWVRD